MASPGLGYLNQNMLATATASGTTGQPINCFGYSTLTAYVKGTGTIGAGVITFEEAHFNPSTESGYAGTWSAITTYAAIGVTGGVQAAVHFPGGGGSPGPYAYAFVRARITTSVTGGGSVTVDLVGT